MPKWYANQREALMMNISMKAKARSRKFKGVEFPAPGVAQVGEELVQARDEGLIFHKKYHAGQMEIYLQDVSIFEVAGKKYLALLLCLSDKRRPDQVLTDVDGNSRRVFTREDGEGLDHSMHLVISADETLAGSATYRLAVESVPNFSISLAARFIQYLVRKLSTRKDVVFSAHAPNGAMQDNVPVEVPLSLASEVRGVPSDELLQDIENGELSEIELVREVQVPGGWDQGNFVREKKYKLSLKPVLKTEGNVIMQALKSTCARAVAENFETATLRWKIDDQVKSARFSCEDAGLLSERYIKSASFDLVESLPGSCETVSATFSRQLAGWVS
jgi:hypothetical protein